MIIQLGLKGHYMIQASSFCLCKKPNSKASAYSDFVIANSAHCTIMCIADASLTSILKIIASNN